MLKLLTVHAPWGMPYAFLKCRRWLVHMISLSKERQDSDGLPLWNAVFCLDCELINNGESNECPACGGRSIVSLSRILGGSLYAHREHQSRERGTELFDITIAVELERMLAKDLTTTLERLTTVIGPMLARDQAAIHVTVRPSEDRFKSQGLLCFPEREAA